MVVVVAHTLLLGLGLGLPLLLLLGVHFSPTAGAGYLQDFTGTGGATVVGCNGLTAPQAWSLANNKDPNTNMGKLAPNGYMNSYRGIAAYTGFFYHYDVCDTPALPQLVNAQQPDQQVWLVYYTTNEPNSQRLNLWAAAVGEILASGNLLSCNYFILNRCYAQLVRCPDCGSSAYSTGCAGSAFPLPAQVCTPCTDYVPPNAVYTRPVGGAQSCGYLLCSPGYWASSPWDAACAYCGAPPANAYYPSSYDGGNWGACTWYCNEGFSFLFWSATPCLPCPPLPSRAVLPTAYRWSGQLLAACLWECPAGTYYAAWVNGCVDCPRLTRSVQGPGKAGAAACVPCPTIIATGCLAGTYPLFATVGDCAVTECPACTNAVMGDSYYQLDPITKLSADLSSTSSCYTVPCPRPTENGRYLAGCGGTSNGQTLDCTVLPRASTFYYSAPGCTTLSPCTACTSAAYYNPSCPSHSTTTLSIVPGECTALCNPPPANGFLLAPHLRSGPVPIVDGAAQCDVGCNAGYYYYYNNNNAACAPCPLSSDCAAGYYVVGCATAADRACVACEAVGVLKPPFSVWGASLSTRTSPAQAACVWLCSTGYYTSGGAGEECLVCTPPDPTACPLGTYAYAPCLLAPGSVTPPVCAPCSAPLNARAVGQGAYLNDATSCAFACNAGFFAAAGGCAPWTAPSPCLDPAQYWRYGTTGTDSGCADCPNNPPEGQDETYISRNTSAQCSWNCTARAYFNDSAVGGGACLGCPPGTAKAVRGDGLCPPCRSGTYQPSKGQATCLTAPAHSAVTPDATGFVCAVGYRQVVDLFVGYTCAVCTTSAAALAAPLSLATVLELAHMASLTLRPSTCAAAAFACALGYYRTPDADSTAGGIYVQSGACLLCPAAPLALPLLSAALSPEALAWRLVQQTSAVVAACGPYPSSGGCTAEHEIALACPPTTTDCVPGYYKALTNLSDTGLLGGVAVQRAACVACADAVCEGGASYTLCRDGTRLNDCTGCTTASLTTGMAWLTPGQSCAVGCGAGFAYQWVSPESVVVCTRCAPGAYQGATPSTATGCTPCPLGTHAPADGLSTCTACPPGSYAPVVVGVQGGASQCLACAVGTYAASARATACAACPPDYITTVDTAAVACEACPPTTPKRAAGAANRCTLPPGPDCPPGFYAESGAATTVCTVCTEGLFCKGGVGLFAEHCPMGSPPSPGLLSTSASQCALGALATFYRDAPPTATMRVGSGTAGWSPTPCPPGTTTYGLTGALSRLWCYAAPGFYGVPSAWDNGGGGNRTLTTTLPCPYDAYCPPPALRPLPCPAAAPFAPMRSTQLAACVAPMAPPCRPGFVAYFDMQLQPPLLCALCPPGCYCPGDVRADGTPLPSLALSGISLWACAPHPNGAWNSPPGATRESDCFWQALPLISACPAFTTSVVGAAYPLTSRLQCRAVARYYYVPGMTTGKLCPEGFYCPAESLQPVRCPPPAGACTADPGYTAPLQRCPAGSATPGPPCNACPSPCGEYTPCSGGDYDGLPPLAYYPTPGDCAFCCPANRTLVNPAGGVGATALQCATPPNTATCSSSSSVAGYYRPLTPACSVGVPACLACPPSLVRSAVFLDVAAVARLAPALFPYAFEGPDSCLYACPPGHCYTPTAATDRYADYFYSPLASAASYYYFFSHRARNATCVPAPPGSFINVSAPAAQGACALCPAGTYLPETGGTACVACPPHSSATVAGATWCACDPGYYYNSSSTTTSQQRLRFQCLPCPAGTVAAPFAAACDTCPSGRTVSPSLSLVLGPCAAGWFRPAPAATCAPCAPGTVAAAEGTSACALCPPGSYADTRATACALCPSGSYAAQSGALQCIACNATQGQTSAPDGTRCLCPSGSYVDPDGICRRCADQCAPVYGRPIRVSGATWGVAEPACTAPSAAQRSDFGCACAPRSAGDGLLACAACPAATAHGCVCPAGSYFFIGDPAPPLLTLLLLSANSTAVAANASLIQRICVPCRVCPLIATRIDATACGWGSLSDTVDCRCPALYFYASERNECYPCTRCSPNADTRATCLAGARRDATLCTCKTNFTGNGLVCR